MFIRVRGGDAFILNASHIIEVHQLKNGHPEVWLSDGRKVEIDEDYTAFLLRLDPALGTNAGIGTKPFKPVP